MKQRNEMKKPKYEKNEKNEKKIFKKHQQPYFFEGSKQYKGIFHGMFQFDCEGFSFEGDGEMEQTKRTQMMIEKKIQSGEKRQKEQKEEKEKKGEGFMMYKLDFDKINKKIAEGPTKENICEAYEKQYESKQGKEMKENDELKKKMT